MKETKDMKDKITDYCLEFIKKDEVKKEDFKQTMQIKVPSKN